MEPSRSCWDGKSALQPEEITSKGTRVSCVYYQKKCPYEKSLETYLMILEHIGCLNIHGTYVTANNSTNNNVFFFVSDLKIVYYSKYQSSITMPWIREEKYFTSRLIWRRNRSKLFKNRCNTLI